MQAIFMIGEQRSGSNLLRLILNESDKIAAPHPPHILQRMFPLLPAYGDINVEDNFNNLIDDVCKLVELNPVKWEKVIFDRKEVRQRCKEKSLIAVYGSIMDLYAEAHHAEAWLCKSMQNIRWADQLNPYFDKPKYIYLYRDPRDVTLSFKKAVIGDKHPYFIAQKWTELQKLCITQQKQQGKNSFFSLCYEELLQNPEKITKDLCQFLNVEFNENMLNFHRSNEAKRSAKSSTLWENLTQPIKADNTNKFLKELSQKEISIVESIAGDVMDQLGYERVEIKKGDEYRFQSNVIQTYKTENQSLKNKMQKNSDPDDLERRNIQLGLLSQIEKRVHV